ITARSITVCDVEGVSMSKRGTTSCLVEQAGEDSIFLVICMSHSLHLRKCHDRKMQVH
ncbi:unnamed protein product, partial [Ectocarpus sp. 6 AP-2014]